MMTLRSLAVSLAGTPGPAARAALALAFLAGTAAPAALAQSSYALTKLSAPFLGQANAIGQIDSQNRVTASVGYLSGFNLAAIFGGSPSDQWAYSMFVSRWPASTATSVSPAKVLAQPDHFGGQSRDGSKVLLQSDGHIYYDSVRRLRVSVPPPTTPFGSWTVRGIRDDGAMVGQAHNPPATPLGGSTWHPLYWAPGGASPVALPFDPAYHSASAHLINARGDVAGEAQEAGSNLGRAALWRASGTMQVLDLTPGMASRTVALTDTGDVLVLSYRPGDGQNFFTVVRDGVTRQVAPPNQEDMLTAYDMNASATVVGTLAPRQVFDGQQNRAFIWKDGVLSDLTAWVKARGLRLPAGAVISAAWSINAEGSILAMMREADGKASMVRLTARP